MKNVKLNYRRNLKNTPTRRKQKTTIETIVVEEVEVTEVAEAPEVDMATARMTAPRQWAAANVQKITTRKFIVLVLNSRVMMTMTKPTRHQLVPSSPKNRSKSRLISS